MADSSLEDNSPMPLPSDWKAIFLAGIFIIMLLSVLRIASEIMMPIVLAFILKLVLHPLMRSMQRLYIPRSLAAMLIVAGLVCGLAGLGTLISGPAASWAEKFPRSLPQLEQKLDFLSKPVEKTQKILVQAEDLAHSGTQEIVPVAVQGTRLSDKVFMGTQAFASGLFTTMLVVFFLLASGDTFLRRMVEILPRFKDKRQIVDISQQIEQDISSYLLTITAVNAAVGLLTGLVMWKAGLSDYVLWGILAFIVNYVPILGPLFGFAVFFLVSMLEIDHFWQALIPPALYMIIHFIEGTLVTPILLARRFTLNPVLVVLALIFWYWMWGFVGAIIAVPMLAIVKIICDRIQPLAAFGHFLGG